MFDRRDDQIQPRRHQPSARFQQPRAGIGHHRQQAGIEPEPSDLIGDDEVGALGEPRLAGVAMDDVEAIGVSVGPRDGAGEAGDGFGFDGIDAGRAGAAREQAQDAGARREIDDDVAAPHGFSQGALVALDARPVGEVAPVLVNDQGQGGLAIRRRRSEAHPFHRAGVAGGDAPGLRELADLAVIDQPRFFVAPLRARRRVRRRGSAVGLLALG